MYALYQGKIVKIIAEEDNVYLLAMPLLLRVKERLPEEMVIKRYGLDYTTRQPYFGYVNKEDVHPIQDEPQILYSYQLKGGKIIKTSVPVTNEAPLMNYIELSELNTKRYSYYLIDYVDGTIFRTFVDDDNIAKTAFLDVKKEELRKLEEKIVKKKQLIADIEVYAIQNLSY